MPTERLAELLVVACEALEAADGELKMIDDPECSPPTPDDLLKLLGEHATMRETLKRVQMAADDGQRITSAWVVATYRATVKEVAPTYYSMPGYPVLPEIVRELASARETIRRAALSDGDVAEVLRAVLPKGWAW